MLTYLMNVTNDLMLVALAIGVVLAAIDHVGGEKAQWLTRVGFVLGLVAAGIRSYITNTRRLRGGWRVGAVGYGISLVAFVVMVAVLIIMRKHIKTHNQEDDTMYPSDWAFGLSSGFLIMSWLYNVMPNVYVYPFKFNTGGNGLLSTDFLMRLGGYLGGLLTCGLACLAAYKIVDVIAKKGETKYLYISFAILTVLVTVFNFAKQMLVLIPRRIIRSVALFSFSAKSNNHSHYYIFAAFILLLAVAVILWVKSHSMQEVYRTNAQHRKQRAMWRSGKRYSVLLSACFVMAILCNTLFVKLNTVVIREAPVEDPVVVKDGSGHDEQVKVTIDMVSDGHLHRFGYKTKDGVVVRFIVVLKQENTNNYGIGLDACEICGEAGYYENNDGQVVCKKCNVVMNKTTIGMKGGCNPIIIDYDIDSSTITVPVGELTKNASHFKN